MFSSQTLYFLGVFAIGFTIFKLIGSAVLSLLRRSWRHVEERCRVYQLYKIPEFNESLQENQLYRQVSVYVSSLASLEDSEFANLFSGRKPNEFFLKLESGQAVQDAFLGAKLSWKSELTRNDSTHCRAFVLKIRKEDKRRILRPYLHHIQTVTETETKKREVRLFTNVTQMENGGNGRWRSVPFTHPATIETVAMDPEIKNKVRSDLEWFAKARPYFHRLGRVWKRSYLLHGPAGTGKTSFVAAMAKLLCYDVYNVDLSRVGSDSQLNSLLLQTSSKSLILIEDLDLFLADKSSERLSFSGILNFMDGIFSCCGEERVMVFTMNSKENIEPAILRPGRVDVQIYFPLCDFSSFKLLATSYLGVKDHKLFPHVEEVFQSGAALSPAELGEILMVNRSSPSRALKSVISALQSSASAKGIAKRLSESRDESGDSLGCRDGVNTVRDFRKLYGLLKMKSSGSRKGGSFELDEKEAS